MKSSPKLIGFIFLTMVAMMADAAETLHLVATIPLPNVKGRIDHLAADVAGHKLYVAALGNNTVEIVDTAIHRHQRSVPGFGEPQGLAYVPDTRRLFVGNGSAGRVDIVDTRSLTTTHQVGKLDDADNVRYDAAGGKIVVGYGKGALQTLDVETGESAGNVSLEGHPESFQLEQGGTRIFVNVPSAGHIAVVDRSKRQVIATWKVSARANFPMALDEKGRRLFVGARTPAVVLVHDMDSGKEVAKLKIGEDTDDLFFDRERGRLYVICGAGQIDVFRQEAADRYVHEELVTTAPRARTGLFVPEEKRLYVAAPAVGAEPARLLVYEVKERMK